MINIFGCSSNSIEDIKILGTNEFSKEAWNSASQEERGKMVFSLLKSHDVKKMKVEEIKSLLGESTAYYEYDEFPAYLIGSKSIKSDYGNGYLLAFPFDRKTGLIRKYIIIPKPKSI
ncbi:hypothetical protein MNBD_GAMMA18-2199 [hydrothermal vent metagenome]|uniref:Uncharacterized protein n=1 Tax=hydrothermal vent metagenome TaxID=652676 RepID=A0A3B0ZJN7_9ZZZZ